jgi:hypothetical protein
MVKMPLNNQDLINMVHLTNKQGMVRIKSQPTTNKNHQLHHMDKVLFNLDIHLKKIQLDLVVRLKQGMDKLKLDILRKDRCQLVMDNWVMVSSRLSMEWHNQDQGHCMVLKDRCNRQQTTPMGLFRRNLVMLILTRHNKGICKGVRRAMVTRLMTNPKESLSMHTIKVRSQQVLTMAVWIQAMYLLHLVGFRPPQRADMGVKKRLIVLTVVFIHSITLRGE